jgi:putative FmdB family regulatory protein
MALYEYRCAECGTEFEKIVSPSSQKKKIACPTCSSKRVKRKLSLFASTRSGASAGGSSGDASCSTGGG